MRVRRLASGRVAGIVTVRGDYSPAGAQVEVAIRSVERCRPRGVSGEPGKDLMAKRERNPRRSALDAALRSNYHGKPIGEPTKVKPKRSYPHTTDEGWHYHHDDNYRW